MNNTFIMPTEFSLVYKRLGIERLVERGESFYQELMQKVVDMLEKAGLVEQQHTLLFKLKLFYL